MENQEDTKVSQSKALEVFLNTIFNQQMAERFPELKQALVEEEGLKELYKKLWRAGVWAGIELNKAIIDLKEMRNER